MDKINKENSFLNNIEDILQINNKNKYMESSE
jgi:hypothetical protein